MKTGFAPNPPGFGSYLGENERHPRNHKLPSPRNDHFSSARYSAGSGANTARFFLPWLPCFCLPADDTGILAVFESWANSVLLWLSLIFNFDRAHHLTIPIFIRYSHRISPAQSRGPRHRGWLAFLAKISSSLVSRTR